MPTRRRSLPIHPAGPQRSLVWFPRFADSAAIDAYRDRYDPRANLIAPHLTLVFPFHSNLSTLQIQTHVKRVARIWPLLPVTFQGVQTYLDEYLFLRVRHGAPAIMELHHQLYRGILAPFLRTDIPYVPHITVGRVDNRKDLASAMTEAWMLDFPQSDTMRDLTLLHFATDGATTAEATIALDQP